MSCIDIFIGDQMCTFCNDMKTLALCTHIQSKRRMNEWMVGIHSYDEKEVAKSITEIDEMIILKTKSTLVDKNETFNFKLRTKNENNSKI